MRAMERFLEERVVPATEGQVKFHARVSVNVLRILQRELELEEDSVRREWSSLDTLLGEQPVPETLRELKSELLARNEQLAQRVQAGDADGGEWGDKVFTHVKQTVRDKAAIADPRLLE
ncbi:MAG: DUF6285 domain-containing protein [Dehalococcoidia bacterium]